VILVDSNILMYAAGVEHKNKARCVAFLERVAREEVDAVLDAEVLQEILHRYRSIKRWNDGKRVYDLARSLFPVVLAIDSDTLDRARILMEEQKHISARDAVHAAVVLVNGLEGICSFDKDFDKIAGIVRTEPG